MKEKTTFTYPIIEIIKIETDEIISTSTRMGFGYDGDYEEDAGTLFN